jgi:hypothetical protein
MENLLYHDFNSHAAAPRETRTVILDFMDPITWQLLSQRKVITLISVWEIVKCIGSSLEANDDFNNDLFYMQKTLFSFF